MDNSNKKIKRCNDTKIATLAKKSELKAEQNKIVKLQAFSLSDFRGKSLLEDVELKII